MMAPIKADIAVSPFILLPPLRRVGLIVVIKRCFTFVT